MLLRDPQIILSAKVPDFKNIHADLGCRFPRSFAFYGFRCTCYPFILALATGKLRQVSRKKCNGSLLRAAVVLLESVWRHLLPQKKIVVRN